MAATDEGQRAVVLRLLRLALRDPGAATQLSVAELDLLMQLLVSPFVDPGASRLVAVDRLISQRE